MDPSDHPRSIPAGARYFESRTGYFIWRISPRGSHMRRRGDNSWVAAVSRVEDMAGERELSAAQGELPALLAQAQEVQP